MLLNVVCTLLVALSVLSCVLRHHRVRLVTRGLPPVAQTVLCVALPIAEGCERLVARQVERLVVWLVTSQVLEPWTDPPAAGPAAEGTPPPSPSPSSAPEKLHSWTAGTTTAANAPAVKEATSSWLWHRSTSASPNAT